MQMQFQLFRLPILICNLIAQTVHIFINIRQRTTNGSDASCIVSQIINMEKTYSPTRVINFPAGATWHLCNFHDTKLAAEQ